MIFQQLQIDLPIIQRRHIEEAVEKIEGIRLETQLGFDIEPLTFSNIQINPDLINPKINTSKYKTLGSKSISNLEDEDNLYCQKSLFFFDRDSPFRRKLIKGLNSREFIWTLRFFILVNTIAYSIYDYSIRLYPDRPTPQINKTGQSIELVCNSFFGIEILFQILAQGFIFEKHTYMRNWWNVLNLICFIANWSVLSDDQANTLIRILRLIRLLKLFRLLQEVPYLKTQVDSFFSSFTKLGNIVIPILVVIFFFGVVGLHLLSGLTEQRCRIGKEPKNGKWPIDESVLNLCGEWECPSHLTCGSPTDYGLSYDVSELYNPAFSYGFNNFDTIYESILAVFMFLNLTGWSATTFMFWKAINTIVTAIYFTTMVFILAYILSNLLLGSLYESFIVQSAIKSTLQKKSKNLFFFIIFKVEQLQEESNALKRRQKKISEISQIKQDNDKIAKQGTINSGSFSFAMDKEKRNQRSQRASMVDYSLEQIQRFSNIIVKNQYFKIFTTIAILGNTFVLCFDYHGMSKKTLRNLEIADFAFTIIFIGELFFKFWAKGFKVYASKFQNKVDLGIMSFQVIILAYQLIDQQDIFSSDDVVTKILKTTKIIRLIKFLYIVKIFRTVSILTRCFVVTLYSVRNIIVVWLFYVVAFSLFGRELFSHEIRYDGIYVAKDKTKGSAPIIHYDDMGNALTAVFNIFYNEEWHVTLYQNAMVMPSGSFIFYLVSIILCQVMFIRLMTAVFLNEFTKQLDHFEETMPKINYSVYINKFKNKLRRCFTFEKFRRFRKREQVQTIRAADDSFKQSFQSSFLQDQPQNQSKSPLPLDSFLNPPVNKNIDLTKQMRKSRTSIMAPNLRRQQLSKKISNELDFDQLKNQISVENQKKRFIYKLSQFAKKIIENKIYKFVMLLAVIITSIKCVMLSPLLSPQSQTKVILDIAFYVLATIYILEILLNWIAFGLVTYLKDSYWNVLSFFVTSVNIISLTLNSQQFVLNFIDSLRILVFIKIGAEYSLGIKYAQLALLNTFAKMFQLITFASFLLIIYGTFAVKLLKGKFYYCAAIDQDILDQGFVVYEHDCYDYGGSWVNQVFDFDNIMNAISFLFIVSTTEAWLYLMEYSWSAVGVGIQPIKDYNRWWTIYFQLFFFFGNLCLINMFISLVVSTYQKSKEVAQNLHLLTDHQREWFKIKLSIYKMKPLVQSRPPENKIRAIMHRIMKIKKVKNGFICCQCFNTLILSLYYARSSHTYKRTLDMTNNVMIGLQVVEILMRLIGKQFSAYLRNFMNTFDLFSYWVVLLNLILFESGYYYRALYTLSVSIQIIRSYRIIMRFKNIEKLFSSLLSVLPNAVSMLFIMFIFLYEYTIIGMDMFAYLRSQPTLNGWDLHFRDFFNAMYSLIRVASQEQWYTLLAEAANTQNPAFACINFDTYSDFEKYGFNACGTKLAYVYFISFHIVFSLMILNLLIASILDALDEFKKSEESAISKYQLNDVLQLWVKYDPGGVGFINYKLFWRLSSEIAIIFGIDQSDLLDINNKKNFLRALGIPIYENTQDNLLCYRFQDVIIGLTQMSVTIKYGVQKSVFEIYINYQFSLEPADKEISDKVYQAFEINTEFHDAQFRKTAFTSGDMVKKIYLKQIIKAAIIYIQQKFRAWKNRTLLKDQMHVNDFGDIQSFLQKSRRKSSIKQPI